MKKFLSLVSCASLAWAIGTCTAFAADDSGSGPVRKKLIELGWDSPGPADLLKNLAAMEKTPFDGVRVQIKLDREGGVAADLRRLFNATPWREEWFGGEVAALRKIHSEKLTDNFLMTGPGPVPDWFDDAGWKIAVEHARIAARIAKQGGLKGLIFDPEISGGEPPFEYKSQARRTDRPFAEYAAKVRQRGREVMGAWAEEFPEMVLFTLFLNTGISLGSFGADPRDGLADSRSYSLYPAFVNGWLDALGPRMEIVDGNEHSYPHSEDLQYLKRINASHNGTLPLIAEENRRKYRTQVSGALAIYMDAFCAPNDDPHAEVRRAAPGAPPGIQLRNAAASAQEYADEYVWIWGEKYRWWPTTAERVRSYHWDDIIPGATQALRDGMDPRKAALLRAEKEFTVQEEKAGRREKPLKNLIANGAFAPAANGGGKAPGMPEHWTAVQSPESHGELRHDGGFAFRGRKDGSACLSGVSDGCFKQEVAVSPFAFYKFRSQVRQIGQGEAAIRLTWLDGGESGGPLGESLILKSAQSPDQGWEPVEKVLRAPEGAKKLRIELCASKQPDRNDTIWYDEADLYRISVN